MPGTFTSRRKLNGYTQGCCPYSPGPVVITPGVTSIPAAAFAGCVTLTSVTLPDTLTDIGDFAFVECIALTTLVIPEGVTSIGFAALAILMVLPSLSLAR